ncbi:MAG: mannose-1-phosphate guanylyltransferase [Candidatus Omnitrophica bacterium]|nr:mannose-1-phosphate guanylyltransferase [Candidatus Omnitrophota bacterium]MCK5493154.1 mannose-1-phosphate guanylyltransferase [Candidatus Omnitrophota bacterium]
MKMDKPIVLILCGGRSLRLWPLSQYKSKNFIDIFGFSPLEITIKRFLKVAPLDNIYLVANKNEKKSLEKLKLVNKKNIIFESEGKNTAAAVFLSLLNLRKYAKNNIIIAPVDALIKKEKNFYLVLNKSLKAASDGWLCSLGIKPVTPDINFGYILAKGDSGEKAKGIYPVSKFIEKPGLDLAKRLISKGNCYFNSGMFISRISTLLEEYKKYYYVYDRFVENFDKGTISGFYKNIKNIPFDKVIMEKTKKAMVIESNFSWKDFGNWQAIYEVLPKDKNGNAKKGNICMNKSANNLVYIDNTKKKILVMGIDNICFVDTKEYTLLTTRDKLDSLKSALAYMNSGKRR